MPPIITLIPIIVALLIIGLALPLAMGRVPPNAFYGYRTRASRGSPRLWYATNRVAARWMMIVGACVIAIVTTMNLIGAAPVTTLLVGANLMASGAVLSAVRAWRLERRLASGLSGEDQDPTPRPS